MSPAARRTDRLEAEVPLPLDLTDPESCERFVAHAVAEGGLDVLVNNAGIGQRRHPFDTSTEEDERAVFETNVNGLVHMTRLALPHIRDGGHIVTIGSVAARRALRQRRDLRRLEVRGPWLHLRAARGLARPPDSGHHGRPPGLARTEFSIPFFEGDLEKVDELYRGLDPLTRDDVADCVMFALTRPPHVNVDEIVVRTPNQSPSGRLFRH